jgi:hypothetical protein
MADLPTNQYKIPLSYIPDQWFILLGDYIDFEKVLVRRPLSDFILRQIPNISWETIAKAQGISPLLFEQLTNFSYVRLCGQRPELNGFAVNPHTIEMRKYEIKDYNWKLYANRAKLDREHFVDHFITFIKNKMIFDDAETQALLEALSHNPFLPSSKQEALQMYQNAVINDEAKQESMMNTIKPQEGGDTAKNAPFFNDEHSFSSQNDDGESMFSN